MPHPSGITDQDLAAIESSIGDAYTLQTSILDFDKKIIALQLGQAGDYDSTLPIAAACLNDAAEFLCETRMALVESRAYQHAASRASDDDTMRSSLFSAHFYWDDVVLRLYATAEDVAAYIENLFGKRWTTHARTAIRTRGTARGSSRFERLYQIMKMMGSREAPELVQSVIVMREAQEWIDICKYRNDWTHNQRWRIAGTGFSYDRTPPWALEVTSKGSTVRSLDLAFDRAREVELAHGVGTATTAYALIRDVVIESRDALTSKMGALAVDSKAPGDSL